MKGFPPYLPTPAEIAAACAAIKADWSDHDRLLRAGVPDGRIPRVEVRRLRRVAHPDE